MSLFAALVVTEILLGFSSSNAVPHSGLQTKKDATSAVWSLRLRGGGLFKKMKRGQPLSQAETVQTHPPQRRVLWSPVFSQIVARLIQASCSRCG